MKSGQKNITRNTEWNLKPIGKKGKIMSTENKIIAFDTETTGVNRLKDELLQISIVNENEDVIFSSYVRPKTRTEWRGAEKVNHISYDMVKDAPTVEEIAEKVRPIFENAEIVIGQNVDFDVDFVKNCLGISIPKEKWFDTLEAFRDETKDKKIKVPNHKLGSAVDFYCPEFKSEYESNAHDAECDTIATMRVYKSIIQKDKPRHFTVEEVNTLSNSALDFLKKIGTKAPITNEKEEDTEIDL